MSSQESAPAIYQFRIWLRGISPTIWRRFLVRSDSTIADLHYGLPAATVRNYTVALCTHFSGVVNLAKSVGFTLC